MKPTSLHLAGRWLHPDHFSWWHLLGMQQGTPGCARERVIHDEWHISNQIKPWLVPANKSICPGAIDFFVVLFLKEDSERFSLAHRPPMVRCEITSCAVAFLARILGFVAHLGPRSRALATGHRQRLVAADGLWGTAAAGAVRGGKAAVGSTELRQSRRWNPSTSTAQRCCLWPRSTWKPLAWQFQDGSCMELHRLISPLITSIGFPVWLLDARFAHLHLPNGDE